MIKSSFWYLRSVKGCAEVLCVHGPGSKEDILTCWHHEWLQQQMCAKTVEHPLCHTAAVGFLSGRAFGRGASLCLICGDLAVFPKGSQLMKTWLKARIISIHTPEGEFTKVACAFSLCASLHKQESHPIFPSGPHGITEPHLFLWHWQYGSKRKIPELPGMPDCWVPESENILPAVSVRKTEQHRLKCQAVFWKAGSLENKGCW